MKSKHPVISFPAFLLLILLPLAGPLRAQSLPQAADDTLFIYEVAAVNYFVLDNDVLDGDAFEVFLVEEPLTGAATLSGDGLLTYTPPEFDCVKPFSERLTYGVCNPAGCDTAQVLIKGLCEGLRVFNGFSPNGDGVNDFFRIEGLGRYGTHAVWVFNRWGEVVFFSTQYRNDWDGTWKNRPLPGGTYYYLIEYGAGLQETGYLQLGR